MLFEPALCVVEGEDGALILAPVRRPCCLELLCCQDVSALSKSGEGAPRYRSEAGLDAMKCPLDFLPSIPQDDRTAVGTTRGMLGLRELPQQPFHARGIWRGVDLDGRVTGDRRRYPGARRFEILCLLRALRLLQH